MTDISIEALQCRLCDGPVTRKFTQCVLGKYQVDYLLCQNCNSLQTSLPFWLEETYGQTLPNLDYGAARRAIRTCSVVLLASLVLRLDRGSRLLDFGGGDGLTCRCLRDVGFEAFVYDKYVKNFYSDGWSRLPDERFDIVCAIEVLEHLPEPNAGLEQIFFSRPRMVVVETDRYHGQGQNWPYIGSNHGGHVFFYSIEALKFIAARYGYDLVSFGSTAVFSSNRLSYPQRLALKLLLRPAGLLLGRIWMQVIRPRRTELPSAQHH